MALSFQHLIWFFKTPKVPVSEFKKYYNKDWNFDDFIDSGSDLVFKKIAFRFRFGKFVNFEF